MAGGSNGNFGRLPPSRAGLAPFCADADVALTTAALT
jgi:hypothetical protein